MKDINMGCYIHLFVEKKVNDKWELVEDENWGHSYPEKNSHLYRLLSGFGKSPEYEIVEPISKNLNRVFPDDISQILIDEYCQIGHYGYGASCDYFGHSYIMLKEINDYTHWE